MRSVSARANVLPVDSSPCRCLASIFPNQISKSHSRFLVLGARSRRHNLQGDPTAYERLGMVGDTENEE